MVERPEVLAAAAFYLASPEAAAVIQRVRDSGRGGMAHACELETSIYLAIDPDACVAYVDELLAKPLPRRREPEPRA